MRLIDDLFDLKIDLGCRLFRIGLFCREVSAKEYLVVSVLRTVKNRAKLAHTITSNHIPGDRRGSLNIVGGSAGEIALHGQFFGNPAA